MWFNAAKDILFMSENSFMQTYGADKSQIPLEWFNETSTISGDFFKWLFTPIIIGLGIYASFKMKGQGFQRKFTLTGNKFGPSFADYQAEHWKVFITGAQFEPDTNPEEDQARTPLEWMRDNDVPLNEIDGFNDEKAQEAFQKQLGGEWKSVNEAPIYIQALCLIFYLSAKRDKKTQQIKETIAIYWTTKKKEEAEKLTAKILEPYLKDDKIFLDKISNVTSKHAYENTALFALLTWARRLGGVLASAEFRWIKPINRSLWYGLNNCGRRAFHIEGAGVVSHYHSEHILKQKLAEPHVDQAVDGLEYYIDEQGILDIEEFFRNEQQEF